LGRSEGRRQLGKRGHRWEDNIKVDLQEVVWRGGMDWTDVSRDRDRRQAVVNAVMNLQVQ
jgi:hypothetical protein